MQSLVLSASRMPKNPSLQCFTEYREKEARNDMKSLVTDGGEILEWETLELRIHPPNVDIDNTCDPRSTVITVDSANRPGTLVEVVQHFTELGLRINKARISSDGGWFVDVFHVVECSGEKVRDARKLNSIMQMLSVNCQSDGDLGNGDESDDAERVETTVFELAGKDRHGLLADITQLLTTNGCNVRSAAVWTHNERVAFVVSVTEEGHAISDSFKLQRLHQLLTSMLDRPGEGIVIIRKVKGEVHHDRRLHRLLLVEEKKDLDRRNISLEEEPFMTKITSEDDGLLQYRSPKHSKPEVDITYCSLSGYWLITIKCKDRAKLFFDTVCTMADLNFEVYHATIDSDEGTAFQEYYVRPRLGHFEGIACQEQADLLRGMLESSIQRRFPKGLKLHVHSVDRSGCLAAVARVLTNAGLSVTRAKVKTYAANNSSGHTFYVMDASGGPPDKEKVELACMELGGKLVEPGEEGSTVDSGGSRRYSFSFSFLQRQWHKGWGGSPSSGSPAS